MVSLVSEVMVIPVICKSNGLVEKTIFMLGNKKL